MRWITIAAGLLVAVIGAALATQDYHQSYNAGHYGDRGGYGYDADYEYGGDYDDGHEASYEDDSVHSYNALMGGQGQRQSYYSPKPQYRGRQRYSANKYARSGHYGYGHGGYNNKRQHYVPVVIKKKKEKKTKIISSSTGFYVPGGTAVFGKFNDLHSCEKACELTPTCFAGDYNPWLGKCYLHSNISACGNMRAHKQITHFKKIPCSVVETPRGLITLGTSAYGGLEQKGIKSLMDCIKGCATAGGGVSSQPANAVTESQICFGIDYNFANHKCYYHTDIGLCGGDTDTLAVPVTPVRLVANPASVNILICPINPE